MGYFGQSAFENDEAVDWMQSIKGRRCTKQALLRPLKRYLAFKPGADKRPLTQDQIESLIQWGIQALRSEPPAGWKGSGRSIEQHLAEVERTEREHYLSGRYVDEQYGPVEPALAAAEIIAVLSEHPPASISSLAAELITGCAVRPDGDVIELALRCVREILANERYKRMRAFYLQAFPDVSGGDDGMRAVKDLLKRLQRARESKAKPRR